MKNVATANTSSVKFRYDVSRELLGKEPVQTNGTASKWRLEGLLSHDIEAYFGNLTKKNQEFIYKSKFTSYAGDPTSFLKEIDRHDKVEFLVLSYLGKMSNSLQSPYMNPDLSTLAFLNRLNTFAHTAESIIGKKTRIVVAAENKSFDLSIFSLDKSASAKTLSQTHKLIREFNLNNITVEPLEHFLRGDYYDEFERCLSTSRNDTRLQKREDFRHIQDIFYFAYPTNNFKEAVTLYTSKRGKAEIRKWAVETTMRYFAFHDARAKTNFWKSNEEYIRSSVSSRPGVLVFQYGPGRVSPFQGVSTIEGGNISTEYFLDIVGGYGKANLSMIRYKGMPFYFDINNKK